MQPTYSADADAYRQKVQAFLAEKLPTNWAGIGRLDGDALTEFVTEWRDTLYEAGLSGARVAGRVRRCRSVGARAGDPRRGVRQGRRADRRPQRRVRHPDARQHDPPAGHRRAEGALPARASCRVRTRGARATASRTPAPISRTSGCKAELDGDQWVLNGQKIWTSAGHLADHIFTLARTDPDAPKHKGISFLLVDMRQPGVEVRPIKMISGRQRVQRGVLHRRHRAPRRTSSAG